MRVLLHVLVNGVRVSTLCLLDLQQCNGTVHDSAAQLLPAFLPAVTPAEVGIAVLAPPTAALAVLAVLPLWAPKAQMQRRHRHIHVMLLLTLKLPPRQHICIQ